MLSFPLLPCRFLSPAIAIFIALFAGNAQALSFKSRHDAVQVSRSLLKAAHIAEANANPRSTRYCWRYVKRALVKAHVVDSYPAGRSAKYAGQELTQHHGFTKLPNIKRPEDAPVGAILVYGGKGHGHVEFRTEDGFVSDFISSRPSRRPLSGVYVKGSSI
jgi:hypothetical protein